MKALQQLQARRQPPGELREYFVLLVGPRELPGRSRAGCRSREGIGIPQKTTVDREAQARRGSS